MTRTTEEVRGPAFREQVERWGVQEIVLTSTRTYVSPFRDVRVQAQFRRGDETVTARGFHDGGQTWKLRFMPPAQGRWTFQTQSNDPELDGQSGAFEVTAPGPGNHGPVGVRGRHFAHADGTPFFPLGTTIYNWLNRGDDLQRRTLATLAGSPFNKVRFLIFPKDMPYNRVDPPLYPVAVTGEAGGVPTFDFGEFNPEFFARIESRLLDLQALGIEAEVILFHPYDRWGFSRMGREHDEAYLRYIVARFSAFRNVWWMLANEYDLFDPGSFLGYRFPERKDWDRLGSLVRDLDPHDHLRAIHNCFGWFDHSRPWVSYVAVQEQSRDLTEVTLRAREYGKPVIVEEYGYEGTVPAEWGNLSAGEVVNRHWAVTLAGGYGSHGETYVRPGDILWWGVGGELLGDSPARLGFLREVMTQAPYEEMEPAPESVTHGLALAKRGEYYLFRFPRFDFFKKPEITLEGEGLYRVELIDTWFMRTYLLGYTPAGSQVLFPHIGPGLLRLVRDRQPRPDLPVGSLDELSLIFGRAEA